MSGWPAGMRFRPIEQWPTELTRSRRRTPFEASLSATQELLTRELKALSARVVVIQLAITEAELRNDGMPRAGARPEHPGVILSLESPYGPLSYPCDTFSDWQSNLRAVALALEALRKVDRYGVTKNGEQYTGWRQLGAGTSANGKMSKWDAAAFIGEHSNAIEEAITGLRMGRQDFIDSLYRRAAKKLHPDAGGDADLFRKLQEAKRVLEGAS